MNIDVFISHSTKDIDIANEICKSLESDGIKCWIASRDIESANEWSESINAAIESSKIMVLVFSEASNSSPQTSKELNLAIQNNHFIVPFKIDNSAPTGSMKYYLSDLHWFDGTNGSFETQIEELKNRINSVLGNQLEVLSLESPENSPQKSPRKYAFIIFGIILLLLTLVIWGSISQKNSSQPEPSPKPLVIEEVGETPHEPVDKSQDIIEELQNLYYEVKSNLKNLTKEINSYTGVTYYYDKDYELVRIDVPSGLTDSASKQYYLKDREIYFALLLDKGKETQFYFQDCKLIMQIDSSGVTHNYLEETANAERDTYDLTRVVFQDLSFLMDSSVYTASNIIKKVETSSPEPVLRPRDEVRPYSPDEVFTNNEFGISLETPYDFYLEHTNYDAMSSSFSTSDGSAKFKICAGYNKGGVTPTQLYNEFLTIYDGTIDYTYFEDTRFGIRILEGDNCHYAYYSVRDGVIRGFEFHFTGQENYDIYIEYINSIYNSLKYRLPIISSPTDYADDWIIGDWYFDVYEMELYGIIEEENKISKMIKTGKNKVFIADDVFAGEYVFVDENKAISTNCYRVEGEMDCIDVFTFNKNSRSSTIQGFDVKVYLETGKEGGFSGRKIHSYKK